MNNGWRKWPDEEPEKYTVEWLKWRAYEVGTIWGFESEETGETLAEWELESIDGGKLNWRLLWDERR